MSVGFRLGFAKAYNDDVAEKKKYLAELNNAKREWLFKTGLEKLESVRTESKAKAQRVGMAERYGFDREAALILEETGELTDILQRITKEDKTVDTEYVKTLSRAVVESVPADRVGQAVNYALDIDAQEKLTGDKLIDIIFSATDEEGFAKAAQTVAGIGSGAASRSMPRLGLNLEPLTQKSPVDSKQQYSFVSSMISPLLGAKLTDSGNWSFGSDETQKQAIVNSIYEAYTNRINDVFNKSSSEEIILELSSNLHSLISNELNTSDILNVLDQKPLFDFDRSNPPIKDVNNTIIFDPPSNDIEIEPPIVDAPVVKQKNPRGLPTTGVPAQEEDEDTLEDMYRRLKNKGR